MKVLNLYAGIGGNRKLWPKECEVTAIENNPQIAKIYQDFFPDDKVIVTDAHKYLLEHYKEFDFIWSSRPCQTYSKARYWASKGGKYPVKYPDMKLYEEIYLLKYFCKCKWVVENVVSYCKPLIEPQEIGKHYFWSNFKIEEKQFNREDIRTIKVSNSVLSKIKLTIRKDAIIRSMVNPKLGLHIFNCSFKENQTTLRR